MGQISKKIDMVLIGSAFFLIIAGIAAQYSTSYNSLVTSAFYLKQMLWFLIGMPFFIIAIIVDYRIYERLSIPLFIISLILLLVVLLFGSEISGSKRWLSFGAFSFQPSELTKLSLIIILARLLSDKTLFHYNIRKVLLLVMVTVSLPVILIVREPDLSSAVIIVIIGFSMGIYMLNLRHILSVGAILLSMVPFLWFFLKDYQKERIITLLNPERDPLGAGYHIIQSKIAIGSGGLFGKGFLNGTQSHLNFLPAGHTDFIFAAVAEEWGLIGGFAIIIAFLIIIFRGLLIAYKAKDEFSKFLAIGITSLFFLQSVINIGMVTGIFPVVGITLPLVSYGGSSLIVSMICIAILINVEYRRFIF
ncbi:MAG: rod shape-determining protein RodA [Thermodesulfobacteriota bacterium]|nr:rod shape-determining protein RodA [Thermodesulfobacteriota bacterium]